MRKKLLITALLSISALCALNVWAKIIDERIYIIPLGNVDKKITEKIKEAIPPALEITAKVEVSAEKELPGTAYDASRKQYDADKVMRDILKKFVLDIRIESALILTDADIYSKEADFVFGSSDERKKIAIVSLARLKNEFYGLQSDNRLLASRAVKESVHEIGHSWGLSHCKNKRCVMYLSDRIEDIDKKSDSFCPACQRSVEKRYNSPLFKTPVF